MAIATQRYVRKPLYVDAVQVTEENFEEIAAWCQGWIRNNDGSDPETETAGGQYIHVRVHQPRNIRQTRAFVGDWILYTDMGYKVYTTKAFEGSFSPVDEAARA